MITYGLQGSGFLNSGGLLPRGGSFLKGPALLKTSTLLPHKNNAIYSKYKKSVMDDAEKTEEAKAEGEEKVVAVVAEQIPETSASSASSSSASSSGTVQKQQAEQQKEQDSVPHGQQSSFVEDGDFLQERKQKLMRKGLAGFKRNVNNKMTRQLTEFLKHTPVDVLSAMKKAKGSHPEITEADVKDFSKKLDRRGQLTRKVLDKFKANAEEKKLNRKADEFRKRRAVDALVDNRDKKRTDRLLNKIKENRADRFRAAKGKEKVARNFKALKEQTQQGKMADDFRERKQAEKQTKQAEKQTKLARKGLDALRANVVKVKASRKPPSDIMADIRARATPQKKSGPSSAVAPQQDDEQKHDDNDDQVGEEEVKLSDDDIAGSVRNILKRIRDGDTETRSSLLEQGFSAQDFKLPNNLKMGKKVQDSVKKGGVYLLVDTSTGKTSTNQKWTKALNTTFGDKPDKGVVRAGSGEDNRKYITYIPPVNE